MLKQPNYNILAFRLAGYGVAIAFVMALLASALSIWLDFRVQSRELDNNIQRLLQASEHSANRAVFELNDQLAKDILMGIVSYPYVEYGVIYDERGNELERFEQTINSELLPFRIFDHTEVKYVPLHYSQQLFSNTTDSAAEPVGRLEIGVHLDAAYAQFYQRAAQMIIISIGWVVLTALVIFSIFYILSTKPITDVIRQLDQIRLGGKKVKKITGNKRNESDEIGHLVDKLNGFIDTADTLLTERDKANTTLRQTYEEIRSLVDFLPQAILIVDEPGTIQLSNKSFRSLIGTQEDRIQGIHREELASYFDARERDYLFASDVSVIQTGNPVMYPEVQIHDALSETRSFEVRKFAIEFQNRRCCLTVAIDTTELKRSADKIQHLAYHDALTDLPNRNLLIDRLNQAILRSRRNKMFSALLFVDLDGFKSINDSLGHAAGDEFLKHVARILRSVVREIDTVARQGGDEFVICLGDLADTAEEAEALANERADRLRDLISQPYEIYHRKVVISASIGIMLFPDEGATAYELLKSADTAMYQAKNRGKDTQVFFERAMADAASNRLRLEHDLREAIEQNEFFLVYQPQMDCQTNQITGAEALLRWMHPERGIVSPGEFIPVLEQTGLVLRAGEWVLKQAAWQVKQWLDEGIWTTDMAMGVNVSAFQFSHSSFIQSVESALDETGIPAQCLDIEITESMVIDNVEDVIARMRQLKALGITFSIDDFGTGYSSLSYLKRLPVDILKIDQSFVRDVLDDPNDEAIVSSILAMASHLGLATTAEGVEATPQLEFLRQQGCSRYQGYLFSRPIPAHDFKALLIEHQ
ncbi:putative bifunctional diguanylate cyclase/phosphodiesterase [Salinibius halmophilus]|uniref:putative bifunctional diguanylate cyclase/phosphodiesterase n=1 Tax=Salinibius halmophilus TaxID=1853216 RepID=UPI000E66632C|nr:bifunctional diguanylate cyclase/phosphodiesterase [Salinibius halmophilus]